MPFVAGTPLLYRRRHHGRLGCSMHRNAADLQRCARSRAGNHSRGDAALSAPPKPRKHPRSVCAICSRGASSQATSFAASPQRSNTLRTRRDREANRLGAVTMGISCTPGSELHAALRSPSRLCPAPKSSPDPRASKRNCTKLVLNMRPRGLHPHGYVGAIGWSTSSRRTPNCSTAHPHRPRRNRRFRRQAADLLKAAETTSARHRTKRILNEEGLANVCDIPVDHISPPKLKRSFSVTAILK